MRSFLYQVRPVIEHIQERMESYFRPEGYLVDDMNPKTGFRIPAIRHLCSGQIPGRENAYWVLFRINIRGEGWASCLWWVEEGKDHNYFPYPLHNSTVPRFWEGVFRTVEEETQKQLAKESEEEVVWFYKRYDPFKENPPGLVSYVTVLVVGCLVILGLLNEAKVPLWKNVGLFFSWLWSGLCWLQGTPLWDLLLLVLGVKLYSLFYSGKRNKDSEKENENVSP